MKKKLRPKVTALGGGLLRPSTSDRVSELSKKLFSFSLSFRGARFFLVHDTKTAKNVPNEHKMYQNLHKISR
jgi:hypothetical protein